MFAKRIKDVKFRRVFDKNELRLRGSKYLFIKNLNDKNTKGWSKKALYFSTIKRDTFSKVKIVRRCILTNRARGVSRFSGLSRILLKDYLRTNKIPGYKKASW
jgi:ribosomal protein S14